VPPPGPAVAADDHAQRLYGVAQALTAALTPDEVAQAIFDRALAELGASTVGLWMLNDRVIRFAGGAGHVDDSPARVGPIPVDSDLPAAQAVRTRRTVTYSSHQERDARWPSLKGLNTTAEAIVVLPLVAGGQVLGALHIGYPTVRPVEEMQIPLLERLAELAAAALHRADLFERERAQRRQLEFFSDATRVLIRSLDPIEVVQTLVDIAVPRLADWCAVLVPDGPDLVTVAVRIAGDDGSEAARVTKQSFAVSGEFHVSRCFRTSRTVVVDPLPPGVEAGLEGETTGVVRRTGIQAAVLVPIEWMGQPMGVLSLAFTEAGRTRDRRLLETAEGLALRAGVALHNAARYDAERTVARTLTEALLPGSTPPIPGYETAVEYLPTAGDVAGDWYDILDLGGRYLIGVGDAAGHGLQAATLMAELRNAARGLAAARHAPAEVLAGMAALASNSPDEAFATAVYGILDPAGHRLDWALAGHLPPLLLRGGEVTALDRPSTAEGPPIASGIAGLHTEQHLVLEPGDTVVFYTDGVVERRADPLEEGVARLVDLLRGLTDTPAAQVVERIVGDLCGDATDDCCVMVLRRDRG